MKLFFGNSLWHLVAQSDAMTKGVLGILLIASIFSWAIFLHKIMLLRGKKKQLKDALKRASRIRSLEELVVLVNGENGTYPGQILTQEMRLIQELLEEKKSIGVAERTMLEEQRFSLMDELLHQEMTHLSFLSVTAAVSPLLGLFGTVWGLTHAFISISEKQVADIVTIAPGMAEALLTTIGGLLVAVPVSIMYHLLRDQIGGIEHQLTQLSDRLSSSIQRVFVEGKEVREVSILSQKAAKGTLVS